MPKSTILFADNDSDFLTTRSDFLEQEGYLVVPATNLTEARRMLEAGGIDMAILDIRLVNDDDEKDTSGLTLAKEVARTVPKIILTGFPSYQAVREALGPALDGLPPAVGFLDKREGPEALLTATRKALSAPKGGQAGRSETIVRKSDPWISGSFYLFAMVIVMTLLAIISRTVPWYVLPIVVIAGLLATVIVGALALRTDESLSEAGFLSLVVEVFRRLPLLQSHKPPRNSGSDHRGEK